MRKWWKTILKNIFTQFTKENKEKVVNFVLFSIRIRDRRTLDFRLEFLKDLRKH